MGKVRTLRNVFIFLSEEVIHQNLIPDFLAMCQHLCILEMKENILGVGLLSIVVLNFSEKEQDMSETRGLNKATNMFQRSFLKHLYD